MVKGASLLMVVLSLSGCAGGAASQGSSNVDSGDQWANDYGGVTIYSYGNNSDDLLQVHGVEGELLCVRVVGSAQDWPEDFDPGSDVDCDEGEKK